MLPFGVVLVLSGHLLHVVTVINVALTCPVHSVCATCWGIDKFKKKNLILMERHYSIFICCKKEGVVKGSSQLIKCKCLEFNVMVSNWSSTNETTTMTQERSKTELFCSLSLFKVLPILASHSTPTT